MTSNCSNNALIAEAMEPGLSLALFAVGITAVLIFWLNIRTYKSQKKKATGKQHRKNGYIERKKPSRDEASCKKPKARLLANLKQKKPPKSQFSENYPQISSEDLPDEREKNELETRPSLMEEIETPQRHSPNHWIHESRNAPRNAPSDTEESLASSTSSGKTSRRQRKNKKRRKKHTSGSNNDECPSSEFGTRFLYERLQTTEAQLHADLLPLCVDVEDRILSGYPYATDMGTFIFKPQGYSSVAAALSGRTLLEAEMNDLKSNGSENEYSGSDSSEDLGGVPVYIGPKFSVNVGTKKDFNMNYYNDQHYFTPSHNLGPSSFRTCKRCREPFCVSNNGKSPCFYHPKKPVIKKDGKLHYQCCIKEKENIGCTISPFHVYYQLYSGLNGPLEGFVSTKYKPREGRVIALDCEMVYTSEGFEIAKVSLVNPLGKVFLDTYVKPIGVVYDYNTQFSGIKEGDLNNAICFNQVQEKLLNIISRTDIIVGHSLEGDLSVLKLIHRRVLDTSLLFKHGSKVRDSRGGSPVVHRQALKALVKKHLGKDIQRESGHSSLEDAAFALNLVLWHLWKRRLQVSKSQKVAPLPLVLQAFS